MIVFGNKITVYGAGNDLNGYGIILFDPEKREVELQFHPMNEERKPIKVEVPGWPPEEVTIAEALHLAGYTAGLIGKWHQGGSAKYHPIRHGFDEFFGFTHEGHYFVPPPYKGVTTMLRRKTLPGGGKGRGIGKKGLIYNTHMGNDEPDYDANNPPVRGGQPVVETEYLTDARTREAVDFIDRHDDNPFFLYLAYNAVHSPLQGEDAYLKKFAHTEDIRLRHFKGKDPTAEIDAVTEKSGNKATPVSRIKVAKGFKVELLYSVLVEKQVSWINLCTDNKGRLLASDQFGGLYRMTPPASGETLSTDDAQPVSANIRAANGMVWAFEVPANWFDQQ
jgi:hypothetical protein